MTISPALTHLIPLTGLTPVILAGLTVRLATGQSRGRPWRLPLADRALITAAALRTNLTTRALAAVFRRSQSMIVRVIRDLTRRLAALLTPHQDAHGRRCTWLLDGTLVPVHDHARTAVSKNYRRSVNVQIVARRCDRRIIAISPAWPGNRNDIIVARHHHTELLADPPRQVLADGAYRSLPGVTTPARDTTGRIIRDHSWRLHRRRRATIEHVIARLKDWQILRQCRRPGTAIDDAIRAVAAIYNHRLDQLRLNS
ncbi:transposase family protein [Dactylosporangium salmoneum]|uniref:DDE Tnp4 domain-containing protein n=1 Tax=Dactylosporangium salmoneum TaxID=53361 RepID=A0ABN3GFD2_9ACTN